MFSIKNADYISISDIAKIRNPIEPKDVVKNWLRNKNTLLFLGLWEKLNNPNFKGVEFDPLIHEAGTNSFTMSPSRWVELTNAIGIIVKNGKNGGTFAHRDIAFENAVFINDGISQKERLIKLNQIAIQQMQILQSVESRKILE